MRAGDVLTIIDLHGNQAVDTLLYAADDTARYSAAATVAAAAQHLPDHRIGVCATDDGDTADDLVADEVGNHDTIGGACSQESNTLRYGHHTKHQHACVENFLAEGARWGLGKRDLVSQHQLLHERSGRRRRHARHRRRPVRAGQALALRAEIDDAGTGVQLPADQQPLQRFRPDRRCG